MMRLKSFEISNFRKFDRPMRLEGLADGINVLAEPNEFGKSTLLAALMTVLFEQHRAKGKLGQSMCHYTNTTSPVINLGFEVAGGLHRIEKRFMHREPYARLTLPDGTRIEGDAAEERLQSILGVGPPGRKGATPESVGVWGALLVAQQEAVRQPNLPAVGRATLHACLETELGAMSGSDRSIALSSVVKAELSGLLDGNGRPKGRLKEISEQLTTADAKLVQLHDKRQSLDEAIGTLAGLRRDLAHCSDADANQQLIDDMNHARRRRDAALQHRHVLQGAVASLELAQRADADVVAEVGRRTSRRQKIVAAKTVLNTARDTEARLLEDQVAAEALLKDRRHTVRSAEDAAAMAATTLKMANAASALVMRSGQIVRLGETLDRATAAHADINRLAGELSANPADATRLHAVTTAVGALDRARSLLDAQATAIVVDLMPGAAERVQVAGSPLPMGPTMLRAVDAVTIDIAGIGRVLVTPAIRNRSTLQAAVSSAEAALACALRAVGAIDPSEAVNMAIARSAIAERQKAAQATLTSETPGEAMIGLRPGLEALRDFVEAGQSRLAAEMTALGLAALPTMPEADAALTVAKTDEEVAVGSLADARTALVGPEAEHDRAASAQRAAVTAAGQARAALAALEQEEEVAIGVEADELLAIRLETIHVDVVARRELVAQMQRDKPSETVEGMDARIQRLEAVGKSRVDSVRRLREEMAGLTTRIRLEEGEGVDEQRAELDRRREELAAEQAALQRDVVVLTLLQDTLAEAEREARERYVAPVLQRVTPYLQGLFPGVEVALHDNLQITQLTRQAGTEDLDRLSNGTVEQVAVLLRLAYADLLTAQGRAAMIVLDDALAYSDHHRLEVIFDMLTRAAERTQILVLTCREDAFSRLGGKRVRLVSA